MKLKVMLFVYRLTKSKRVKSKLNSIYGKKGEK